MERRTKEVQEPFSLGALRERFQATLHAERERLASADEGALLQQAHRLAGTASVLGFPAVGTAARALEDALRRGDAGALSSLRAGLEEALGASASLALAEEPAESVGASGTREGEEAPTVLVIDDNEYNRELARAVLEDEGLRVVLASGGREGLALALAAPPACILLDACMPEMDGFAMCRALRASASCAEVPVLFVSALHDPATRARALALGARELLTKPVDTELLLEQVRRALGGAPRGRG